VGVAA
jgi:hypothetical protein